MYSDRVIKEKEKKREGTKKKHVECKRRILDTWHVPSANRADSEREKRGSRVGHSGGENLPLRNTSNGTKARVHVWAEGRRSKRVRRNQASKRASKEAWPYHRARDTGTLMVTTSDGAGIYLPRAAPFSFASRGREGKEGKAGRQVRRIP